MKTLQPKSFNVEIVAQSYQKASVCLLQGTIFSSGENLKQQGTVSMHPFILRKKNDIAKYHGSFICNSISGIEFVSKIDKQSLNHIESLEDLLHKYIYE